MSSNNQITMTCGHQCYQLNDDNNNTATLNTAPA